MKRHIKILTLCLLALILLAGCGTNTVASNSKKAKAKPKIKVTAQLVVNKLKEKEGQYMTNISNVTAENDPNKLLGRPNQYTEKITWSDSRSQNSNVDCSIELFKNKADADSRKKYLETVIKSMPMLTQYIEQKNNVLIRVDGVLTPSQANEYINVFKSMDI